jgi:N-acetylmuramoyl-L-alanine amidase
MVPGVRFIVAHDTANPGADAMQHARWYRNDPNPAEPSSAHLFVDDVAIIETVPALTTTPEQALHVRLGPNHDNGLYGFDANRAAIGVEYCYGPGIEADAAYARYTWVLAKLCHQFGLDPSRAIVGHHILDPSRRHDPESALSLSGRTYEGLLRHVVETYQACLGGIAGAIGQARIGPGDVVTTVHLRLREAASTASPTITIMPPGTTLAVTNIVDGEPVNGNADWCKTAEGFCWSGGVRAAA